MDFDKMSDNEIIEYIKKGNDDAMDYMVKRYGTLVKKEVRALYLIGAETEDLTQEGMIGLFKAIRDFEPEKNIQFSTFATLCIRSQIKTAITASNRKKHLPLNGYLSLYAESGDEGFSLLENLTASESTEPERQIIARESIDNLKKLIDKELSSLEKTVLELYLSGLSYSEISEKTGKSEKSIGNALSRIRTKVANFSEKL